MYGPFLAGVTILVTSLLAYFNPGIFLNTLGSGEDNIFATAAWNNPFAEASIHSFADFFISLQADIIIPKVFSRVTSSGGPYIVEKAANLTNLTTAASMYAPLPNYTLSPIVLYPTLYDEGLPISSVPLSFWIWSITIFAALLAALGYTMSVNFWLKSELFGVLDFEDILWRLFSITKSDDAEAEARLREVLEMLESQGLGRDPHYEDLLSHISFVVEKTRAAHLLSCLTIEVSNSNTEREAALVEARDANAERDAAVAAIDNVSAERDTALATINKANAERDTAVAAINDANAERDAAMATIDKVNAERDAAQALVNNISAERDNAVLRFENVTSQLDTVTADRDYFRALRDGTLVKLHAVNTRISELESELKIREAKAISKDEEHIQELEKLALEKSAVEKSYEQRVAGHQERILYLEIEVKTKQEQLDNYRDRCSTSESITSPSDHPSAKADDPNHVAPCDDKVHNINNSDAADSAKLDDGNVTSPSTSSAGYESAPEEPITPVTRRKKARKGKTEYNAQKLRLRKEEAAYIAKYGTTVHGTPPPAASSSGQSSVKSGPDATTPSQNSPSSELNHYTTTPGQTPLSSKPDSAPIPRPSRQTDPPKNDETDTPFVQPELKRGSAPGGPTFTPPTPPSGHGGDHTSLGAQQGRGGKRGRGGIYTGGHIPISLLNARREAAEKEAAEKEAAEKAAQKKEAASNAAPANAQSGPETTTAPKSDAAPKSAAGPKPADSHKSHKPDAAPKTDAGTKPDDSPKPDTVTDAGSKPDTYPARDGTPDRPSSTPFVQPKLKPKFTPIQPPRFTQPTPPSSDRGRGGQRGRGGIYTGGHIPISLLNARKEAAEKEAAKKAAEEKKSEA